MHAFGVCIYIIYINTYKCLTCSKIYVVCIGHEHSTVVPPGEDYEGNSMLTLLPLPPHLLWKRALPVPPQKLPNSGKTVPAHELELT